MQYLEDTMQYILGNDPKRITDVTSDLVTAFQKTGRLLALESIRSHSKASLRRLVFERRVSRLYD